MQINPMQRKTRNSFLLGMLVTLLITGAIIIILFLQLKNMKDKEIEEAKLLVKVFTINQDVKSGQVLTEDMITQQTVNRSTVPSNATSIQSVIDAWFLQTKDGEQIFTDSEGLYMEKSDSIIEVYSEEGEYYIYQDGEKVEYDSESNIIQDDEGAFAIDKNNEDTITRIYKEESTENYYIYQLDNSSLTTSGNKSRIKKYIEIDNVPLVAKVAMNANTVITPELVVQSDEVITDDTRIEEYNMISLPIDLMTGDYADIRLMTPNGQNFIVVSKVLIEVPTNDDGSYVADTIRIKLREDEILLMSSAIVEAYGMTGAKLYATKYVEAGTQGAATVTYVPNKAVSELINNDPNIVAFAMQELRARYTQALVSVRNDYLQSVIDRDESYTSNVQTGLDESTANTQQSRKNYLDSLGESLVEEY